MGSLFLDYDRVRSLKATELRLPLSRTERPFEFLSDALIGLSAHLLSEFPEKRGRLSEAISLASGLPIVRPKAFTVLESHIDVNSVDDFTFEALIQLGFEPDDFFRLHPECYLRHFTLQFFVDRPNSRRLAVLRDELKCRTSAALRLLRERSNCYGYVETEVYISNAICSGRAGTVSEHCLEAFASAFDRFRLERREISNSDLPDEPRLPAETVKAADLHIKFKRPDSCTDLKSTKALGELLADRGLYEIVSEAGNSIYTAQFLTASYAKRLFEDLKLIVIASNAPVTVCWEPCIGFVRFGRQPAEGGATALPPIPPVLVPSRGPGVRAPGSTIEFAG